MAAISAAVFAAAAAAQATHALTVCPAGPPQCGFANVQDALAAASDGDKILVAAGTYPGGLTIDKSVRIVGAGAGQTVLSGGDLAGVQIPSQAQVEISGLAITAVVGTGVVNDGDLTLSHSAVSANGAFFVDNGGIDNNGTLVLRDGTVTGNVGRENGGLRNVGSATVVGSTFDSNEGTFEAGNIENEGSLVIRKSVISTGICQGACALLNTGGGAAALIVDTLVSGNGAEQGGPVSNEGGSLTIRRSTLSGGDAAFGPTAGALSNSSGSVVIDHSRFTANAVHTSSGPGAIRNDGTMTVRGTTVEGNLGGIGGGIGNYGNLTLRDSVVTGNTGDVLGIGSGGGIYNAGSLIVRNTTVSGNTAETIGGGILNDGDALLVHSLVTGNTAVEGLDGLFGGGIYNAGTILLRHTGVSGNTPDDCVGC